MLPLNILTLKYGIMDKESRVLFQILFHQGIRILSTCIYIPFILDRGNRCSSRSPLYLLCLRIRIRGLKCFSLLFLSALLSFVLLKRVHAIILHRLNLTRFLTQLHHHFDIYICHSTALVSALILSTHIPYF